MSWYSVAIYREPVRGPWEELLDHLGEAAGLLEATRDESLVGVEIGHSGEPTGVILRYCPEEANRASDPKPVEIPASEGSATEEVVVILPSKSELVLHRGTSRRAAWSAALGMLWDVDQIEAGELPHFATCVGDARELAYRGEQRGLWKRAEPTHDRKAEAARCRVAEVDQQQAADSKK